MTSQDIKKQLKEPHFWNIVLTGQHAEPRTKAMLEAKGIITWLPLAPVRRQWGRILKEIHTPVIPRCVFVYISNEERNTLQNPTDFFHRKLYFKNCQTDAIRTSRYMPTCSH